MVYRYHTLHSPTETVSIFTIPAAGVRRWNESVIVYDVQVGGGLVLRHYGFCDRWFEINCSLDLTGRFITEPGPDGRTHVVIDEDDFAEAVQRRWLTPEEQVGARRGLEELLSIIRGTGLLPFLNEVCPFGDLSDAELQPPLTTIPLAQVPLLAPGRRTDR